MTPRKNAWCRRVVGDPRSRVAAPPPRRRRHRRPRSCGPRGRPALPASGSEATRDTASPPAVTATARTSASDGIRRLSAARVGTAQTIPLTTIGCTTAIGPACRAIACSAKARSPAPARPAIPAAASGSPAGTSRPAPRPGASSAAWCCTELDTAKVAALSRASVTASAFTGATLGTPRSASRGTTSERPRSEGPGLIRAGAPSGTRTPNPLIKSQLLCQLS